ncbi:MAG: DUF4388 domain-containing protein [FCB group bacterium]|nr:DUF4388 domain-containing protein [FCB group bacterium]
MMDLDLGLQGNIEKFTLAEIFQLIAASRKSGTLGIQKDDSIVMVYFKEGNVVYGYGPRQTFHLGQFLKEKGIISDTQLEKAIRIQSKTENTKRLGEILISHGFIDRSDLQEVIKKQVEELLFSLLSWKKGSFKFYENQFPTEEEITVSLSVENIILEGLRRLDEMNMVKDVLPNLDDVYTISAAQGGRTRDVSLQAKEWNIMALVDGHRSINEVCRYSSMTKEETLKKLAQLKLAGLITKTERKETPSNVKLEKMISRLSHLFEEYLTEKTAPRVVNRKINKIFVEPKS